MGKHDDQQDGVIGQQKQKNKSHKTLRQKLRKKRLQEKQHLKQKKQKRKQFDPEAQKRSFFIEHFNSISQDKYKEAKKQFKYKKVTKYIEKFINIYQDDLQDFFSLFKQFDQGGFIDISGLQNKKLHKILVKLFKHLPLTMTQKNQNGEITTEYRKKKQSLLSLENVIRNLVTKSIQNYMENGTEDEKDKSESGESSDDDDNRKLKQLKSTKKQKDVTVNIRDEDKEAIFTLPKPKFQQVHNNSFGPIISAEERDKIAQMFEKQLEEMQKEKQLQRQLQEDKFDQIFSMGQATNKLKNPQKGPKKSTLEDFPAELLAQGSAKIGQKITINQDEQKQYDAIHRPRKLIDQHRQIMAINRGDPEGQSTMKRKPFDRERDVVNSRNKLNSSNLTNGLFFDFKDKMTAPKKTNSFL